MARPGRSSSSSMTAGRRRAIGRRGRRRLTDLLAEAEREDRQVVLVTTAPPATSEPPAPLAPIRAADARAAVQALQPKPWPVDRRAALTRLEALSLPECGLRHLAQRRRRRRREPGARRLSRRAGQLALPHGGARTRPRSCSLPATCKPNDLGVRLRSLPVPTPRLLQVRASGEDGRLLARQAATIEPGGEGRRSSAADAERAEKPGRSHRNRRRSVGRLGAAGR